MIWRTGLLAISVGSLLVTLGPGAFAAADTMTVKGEVIDVTCHTKQGEKAMGEKHSDCALTCAKKGAPMGISADGKVYNITGGYAKDNNAKLLEFVGKPVEATGDVTEKDGKLTIDVASMKAAG
jgi:hypothetical protein